MGNAGLARKTCLRDRRGLGHRLVVHRVKLADLPWTRKIQRENSAPHGTHLGRLPAGRSADSWRHDRLANASLANSEWAHTFAIPVKPGREADLLECQWPAGRPAEELSRISGGGRSRHPVFAGNPGASG